MNMSPRAVGDSVSTLFANPCFISPILVFFLGKADIRVGHQGNKAGEENLNLTASSPSLCQAGSHEVDVIVAERLVGVSQDQLRTASPDNHNSERPVGVLTIGMDPYCYYPVSLRDHSG